MSARKTIDPVVLFPGTIVIDSREQRFYKFEGMISDARDGRRPLVVPCVMKGLRSGDYSLEGHEDRIAIERKSLADAYGTFGRGRGRFQRELARLNEMPYAAVIVEAEWSVVFRDPPERAKLPPKTLYRSIIAWQQRFPRVHWWFVPNRIFAERTVLRIFERYLKDRAVDKKCGDANNENCSVQPS